MVVRVPDEEELLRMKAEITKPSENLKNVLEELYPVSGRANVLLISLTNGILALEADNDKLRLGMSNIVAVLGPVPPSSIECTCKGCVAEIAEALRIAGSFEEK